MHFSLRSFFFLVLIATPLFAAEPEKPKLVVLVVFDQMRGDYIAKWQPQFGEKGFKRLQTQGAWFVNCHYPYSMTATGPGHASMLTGCGPDVHGIIGNTWYERQSGATGNCSESRDYGRIPPLPKVLPKDEVSDSGKAFDEQEKKVDPTPTPKDPDVKKAEEPAKVEVKSYGTADRLLAPTFGDALKLATEGKGKVIGLSFKDRSAVLPTGKQADGAYWVDGSDGMIVTSTAFRDAVHPWVAEINNSRLVDSYFGKTWERSRLELDYVKLAGPDSMSGEGKGKRQGMTFPHPMDGGLKKPGKAYYEALANSPYGNEFLLKIAQAAIVNEKLGQDETPDLLSVSFSSNDLIGHTWGPDSQEVLDVTLRSDLIVAELLKFLDEKVGEGKYLVCLTADHGICPNPEFTATRGMEVRRLGLSKILSTANTYLRYVYEPRNAADAKTKYIENYTGQWVTLNHKTIESKGLVVADVAATLSQYLNQQDGIDRTFTRTEMERPADAYDAIGKRVRKSFHAERSGDLAIILKPYWLENDPKYPTGTSHGSPHSYDTHVPLLVFGPGVKPGIHRDDAVPAMIASIFAKSLGIKAPAKAEYPVPAGLFEN